MSPSGMDRRKIDMRATASADAAASITSPLGAETGRRLTGNANHDVIDRRRAAVAFSSIVQRTVSITTP